MGEAFRICGSCFLVGFNPLMRDEAVYPDYVPELRSISATKQTQQALKRLSAQYLTSNYYFFIAHYALGVSLCHPVEANVCFSALLV